MNICIVIPAYNESNHIGSLLDALRSKNFDVIVVDDGSTDGTKDIAEEKGAIVIRHDTKHGKGYALRKGFDYATAHDYDGLIAMDGDGQHHVDDIDQFVNAAHNNKVCVVTGNRMARAQRMPWIRYCTNRFMSWLISLACGQKIPDTQCGFRYIGCDVLRNIDLTSQEFEIESEILIKASKKGFQIENVAIRTIYSNEQSHINPLRDTFRFIVYFINELCSLKKT